MMADARLNGIDADDQVFNWARWAVVLVLLCLAPLGLLAVGVDFSTAGNAPATQQLTHAGFSDVAHHALHGSFTHTILEWTAVCLAAFVALLAFVHYRLRNEPSVPIIGVALICAGGMDAFHTFAADRLISAVADNRDLIPFTWAVCRLFNATILLVGVGLVLRFPMATAKNRSRLIGGVGVMFVGIAYLIVSACGASDTLPQTMFRDAFIKRPYDLFPLIPFMACALIAFPRYQKRYPSIFAQTLLLGLIPAIATQLYMAFGSFSLHDSCFNIAHAAKALSYAVPLLGLLVDYAHTYRCRQSTERELREIVAGVREQNVELAFVQAQAEQANIELSEQAHELERSRRASLNIMEDALAARRDADAANRTKSEFLANMSHEIRTPMTAILGFAETLADNESDPEKTDAVATIRRNGEHLLSIINDILDLSKVEADRMTIEHIPRNPCEIIRDVISLMTVKADGAGLALNVEYVGDIPETIQTDPAKLRQILVNLIGNSIKFTEVGGVRLIARIIADEETPAMQIDVLDTGIGMTRAQVMRLFQPFSQADNSTTRRFGGTGLGLAISKRFAEMLGGGLALVDAEEGVGTRFRLTIATGPLDGVKMLADPMSATLDSFKGVPFREPRGGAKTAVAQSAAKLDCRILLAEDGPDNQRLISHILKKAGARVSVVANGKLSLESALAERDAGTPYDVILMDMQMPVMDGYEATRKLRENNYDGPIIALTAHAMDGDRDECIAAGCDGYATKPIDRKRLIEIIRAQLTATANAV